MSTVVWGQTSPALLTRTSSGPWASPASAANPAIDRVGQVEGDGRRLVAVGPELGRRSSQRSTRRAPSTTGWPAAARAMAVARPMPDEAPVTTAGRRPGAARTGASAGHHRGGEGGEAPDVDGVDAADAGRVDVVVGDAGDGLLEADPRLEPGQRGAQAEVAADAEAGEGLVSRPMS